MKIKLIITILFFFFSSSQRKQNCTTEQFAKKKIDPTEYQVQCIKKEKIFENKTDPILIKICDFRNFRSVRTGTADDKGRYSYNYELYVIKENGKKKKIKNSDFFNSAALSHIEQKINRDIQKEYERNLNIPQLKDCMKWIDFRQYKLNEMGMAFSENNKIEFYINYEIGGACFNVSFTILDYKISEFKEYMK